MTNTLAQTPSPTLIRPARSLGGITFDIVVEETHEDGLVVTEHPVERGAPISDHAYLKPKTVSIRGGASDAGGSLNPEASSGQRSIALYDKLLELQARREPFDVITGKRSYKNMLLETISVSTDSTSIDTLWVMADCREVIIVETQSTSVPPSKRHANGAKTGGIANKGDKQLTEEKRSTIASATGGSGHRRPGGPAT